jgi:Ni,Fe-hydrogenase III large subunit
VRHFEHSYELSNFAELLYNLGKAYAQWYDLKNDLSLLRKAKRLFQNYTKRLTENPEMDQSQRAEAEAQIARHRRADRRRGGPAGRAAAGGADGARPRCGARAASLLTTSRCTSAAGSGA